MVFFFPSVALALSLAGAFILATTLLFFLGFWLYLERREAAEFDRYRNPAAYVCVRCSHVYTSDGRQKKSSCPQCGHVNIPLRF